MRNYFKVVRDYIIDGQNFGESVWNPRFLLQALWAGFDPTLRRLYDE